MRLPKQLQLAQLVDRAPEGDDWLHEQKFDGYRILAHLDGRKLRLLSRRFNDWTAQFPAVVDAVSALPVSDHVIGNGEAFFQLACKRGLEGIVSKKRDAPYSPGRGKAWLKTKCLLRQELVIGGYTDPEGARTHIGALLVGYYEEGKLVYAGKVGTGFTGKDLVELKRRLAPLEVARAAFDPEPPRAWTGPNRHWVSPALVAEVAFSEWTNDGRLRHPSFQGLRRDKPAAEIVRERVAHVNR